MSRYIDLVELERRIKENVPTSGAGETPYEVDLLDWCKDECIRQGYAMPTADVVEVRHGRWLSAYEYSLKFDISEESRNKTKNDSIWKFCCLCDQSAKWDYNYCPNCGAKMDGRREE